MSSEHWKIILNIVKVFTAIITLLITIITFYFNFSKEIKSTLGIEDVTINKEKDNHGVSQEKNTEDNNDTPKTDKKINNEMDSNKQIQGLSGTQPSSTTKNQIDLSSDTKTTTLNNHDYDDIGYFDININGIKYTYEPDMPFSYFTDWECYLNSNRHQDSSHFSIKLPSDVKTGDSFEINSEHVDIWDASLSVTYCNKNNEIYVFGYPLGSSGGQHFSSNVIIEITQWNGMDGFAYGTFIGQIKLTENDIINFTNGRFKIKIQSSGF
ncbi:hypothetical protein Dtox_1891 [Desulfofarcimen acetoxidans DSM 771]|uniref:Uncharacterized protein n=1 Tax=Desulfofarcimen acetoxidans (strain ATCC 49208 / DSM 771 / KCTC 5769 / VKM B-1644 / 5575) TaxID=485916 RepID=C8VXS9_DESAS|nr:hypothetical protein [Desulfofarcimen acetoxidans]ACV62735.1 hypothetical protein Dtox_1891 [Desulfofarcimen acetoxidans DSM 771]